MTKEQEEAIKTMKHWIDFEKQNKDKINKADELIKIQETVLNMLKEKDKEIEKKDKQIDLMAIRILVKIIGDYPCTYKESCTKSDEKYRDFKCKECIKQYFERKSEE